MNKDVVKALQNGKRVLLNNKWTTGVLAKKANGHTVCDPLDPSAKCFCALGALCRGNGIHATGYAMEVEIDSPVYLAANVLDSVAGFSAAEFNDNVARNKRDVVRVYDEAITFAKKNVLV